MPGSCQSSAREATTHARDTDKCQCLWYHHEAIGFHGRDTDMSLSVSLANLTSVFIVFYSCECQSQCLWGQSALCHPDARDTDMLGAGGWRVPS